LSRLRLVALVVGSVVALAAAGFGIHALQVRSGEHAKAAALRSYLDRVGPPTRSLYQSWSTFQASIDRPEGSDELAVKGSYDTATKLRGVLSDAKPPRDAQLFHHEMTDVVKNVLTVIDARVRLALTGPEADDSGRIRDPEEQKRSLQLEAGNAFYVVKQTFPDAIAQLRALEARTR
jgi:hypothetical protein